MRLLKAFSALLALLLFAQQTPLPYGPQGAEGEPNRAQPWLVPTPAADHGARAVLFRPPGEGPFHLAVIAHATTQNVLRRAQMPQPEYRALAAFLVARGFAVLVPERLGPWRNRRRLPRGPGRLRRGRLCPLGPRHRATQIRLALDYLRGQPFIRPRWRGRDRPFGRRLGRAGAGRRRSEGGFGHHRLRARPRRPRQ